MQTALIVARKPVSTGKGDFTLLFLNNGKQLVIPKGQDTGEPCVTYVDHKKGDTFVATRDSSRKDSQGNILYAKGDTVTRDKDSTEIVGFTTIEVYKALKG